MYSQTNTGVKSALSKAPPIPDEVYDLLPEPLASIGRCFDSVHERDAALLATIAVYGSCMPNLVAPLRDRLYSPSLFFCVLAPPGSGKGAMRWARRIGHAVDAELAADKPSGEASTEGAALHLAYPRGLLIPANTSAAALQDALEANGGHGLIFESETDTITEAMGQEWGGFSDVLRKAAEHEPVTLLRKDRHVRIEKPKLTVVLAGTPGQLSRLIKSGEDGLFSRFGFYITNPPVRWATQRPTEKTAEVERVFGGLGALASEVFSALSGREVPLEINLTERQWDEHDREFEAALARIETDGLPRTLEASVKRAGVTSLRIASVLAVTRAVAGDTGDLADSDHALIATDQDAKAGRLISATLLDHARVIAPLLHKTSDPLAMAVGARGQIMEQFHDALPNGFFRADAVEVGGKLGISKSSVQRYLKKLDDSGAIVRISHGHYMKKAHHELAKKGTPPV